jgi:hypothetical protein
MIEEQAKPPQRRQSLFARLFRQAVGLVETGAQAGEDFFVEDRSGDSRRSRVDDEADRVRSDVDDPCRFGVFQA